MGELGSKTDYSTVESRIAHYTHALRRRKQGNMRTRSRREVILSIHSAVFPETLEVWSSGRKYGQSRGGL
jgi:predicted component of type VI protein secretion system